MGRDEPLAMQFLKFQDDKRPPSWSRRYDVTCCMCVCSENRLCL